MEQELALVPKDGNELELELLEAKVEIFFFTSLLPQLGQTTVSTALELRTSSSNGLPHSLHTNSNIGMDNSFNQGIKPSILLDAFCASWLQYLSFVELYHPPHPVVHPFWIFPEGLLDLFLPQAADEL